MQELFVQPKQWISISTVDAKMLSRWRRFFHLVTFFIHNYKKKLILVSRKAEHRVSSAFPFTYRFKNKLNEKEIDKPSEIKQKSLREQFRKLLDVCDVCWFQKSCPARKRKFTFNYFSFMINIFLFVPISNLFPNASPFNEHTFYSMRLFSGTINYFDSVWCHSEWTMWPNQFSKMILHHWRPV